MKTPGLSLRALAVCSLLVAVGGCGGGGGNDSSVSLSGTITGLTENGLILSNGSSSVALGVDASRFTFPSRALIGSTYSIQATASPPTLICTVTNGTGVATGDDVTNIAVACVPRRTLGGTITGLTAGGLILANGGDTVRPAANTQSFVFPGKVGQGFSYGVTVLQQPAPQTCSIANGTGVMGTADINNVQVACR